MSRQRNRLVPRVAAGLVPWLLVGLLLVDGNALALTPEPRPPGTHLQWVDQRIDHIVFLMQENHAYDNLFGTYCGSLSTICRYPTDGIPSGTCVPYDPSNLSKGCVVPYNLTAKQLAPPDMPHTWGPSHEAYNNGSMNGFYAAEGNKSIETFGHYNGSTVPVDWDLAEEYALGDDYFSGSLAFSLPNHWYAVAPTSPSSVQNGFPGENWPITSLYLNQSNQTPNIESELLNSSVSWSYYDFDLQPTYQQAISPYPGNTPLAYDLWNPLAARAQSYTTGPRSHFETRASFFGDAANGTLPNVSWLIPSSAESDHPPMNMTTGQDWIASVVDALESSPEWNSTLLFISWDEYGGWYDHVAPPTLDAYGAGFRVPMLAVGPWVREGYVDDTFLTPDSVLHLMERRFGLPCLGPRDCHAALPLDLFAYQRSTPRPPMLFADNGTARYPMPLQSMTARYQTPTGYVPFDDETMPVVTGYVDWS